MSLGWAHGIRSRAESDEAAFLHFFELLEELRDKQAEPGVAPDHRGSSWFRLHPPLSRGGR